MFLPNLVRSLKFVVRRKTTYYSSSLSLRAEGLLPTTYSKVKHGFTLIELLVVISIIAVLVGVASVSYSNAQKKARDNRRKSDLKSVQQALELYFQQNGKYPDLHSETGGRYYMACNVPGDSSWKDWGTEFSCDENGAADPPKIVYMKTLPKDPLNITGVDTTPYFQYIDILHPTDPQYYVISAKLENTSDP